MEGNSSLRQLNCSNVSTIHDGATLMATTVSSREFNQDTGRAKKGQATAPCSLPIEDILPTYC